jgi:hypothetical protein
VGDITPFGSIIAIAGAIGLAAVLSSRFSSLTRIPSPALFLAGGAIAANVANGFGSRHRRYFWSPRRSCPTWYRRCATCRSSTCSVWSP